MRHAIAPTPTPSLPTSRSAPQQERAVLAILRAKAPQRAMSTSEAERVAEWQAQTLLELGRVTSAPVPSALIAELPRVSVLHRPELQVTINSHTQVRASAGLKWHNGRWLILLDSSEPATRQRFSLAHEFKHLIDHRFRTTMYVETAELTATEQFERAADVFAACLLMPRPLLRRAWANGHQRVDDLARMFDVSPRAMARRLSTLGITGVAR